MSDFDEEDWFEWISLMDLIDAEEEEQQRKQRALAELDAISEEEEENDWYEGYEDYEDLDDDELERDEILGRDVKRLEKKSGKRWTNNQRFLCELLLDSGISKVETLLIVNRMALKMELLPQLLSFIYNDNKLRSKEEIMEKLKELGV